MTVDPAFFDHWFHALNGVEPFPWQRRLFREWLCPSNPAAARWPNLIQLPTAAGKTALIDLAVLALAAGSLCAHRRIAFVVDRRLVVDEAARRGHMLAQRLRRALDDPSDVLHPVARSLQSLGGDEPFTVAILRGGMPVCDDWARSPAQPALLLSTVDQVGSRLLFRAYGGHGPRSWPIHAGLLGRDTLYIVDEAHCAVPLCQTLQSIASRWQWLAEQPVGQPIELVRLSATPSEQPDFTLAPDDQDHPVLSLRLRARKPATLVLAKLRPKQDERSALVDAILEQAANVLPSIGNGVLGIVVNRVASARAIFERLALPAESKLLLTGRARGWERDRLLESWLPRLRAGERLPSETPLAVVATQCIEIGANLDFDALVTEAASLDALRQRFGRLNRLGQRDGSQAVIVATHPQVELDSDGQPKNPDPIYGQALARTWSWLLQQAHGSPPTIDFGVLALEPSLPAPEELAQLCVAPRQAYPLLPSYLDLLAQTSPPPAQDPEIACFLHGAPDNTADVTVVWRCDLPEDQPAIWPDRAAIQPPVVGEGCPVPIWEFRRWLESPAAPLEDAGDIEAAPGQGASGAPSRLVLRWLGPTESEPVAAGQVFPGDTILVPSSYGGCDRYGWNPQCITPVADIADAVAFQAGRRPVLRLHALEQALAQSGMDGEAWALLNSLADLARQQEAPPLRELLSRLAAVAGLPDWVRQIAVALSRDPKPRLVETLDSFAILGRRGSGEDLSTADDGANIGAEVPLEVHSKGVQEYAERFCRLAQVPPALASDLALAAWFHDVGKADPRFQTWLHGGDEIAAALSDTLLAKSGLMPRDRAAIRRARELAGYPANARHELQSLALISESEQVRHKSADWDLVRHLVASHHGFARPFVSAAPDLNPVRVELTHGTLTLGAGSAHALWRLDSGVAERYWRLVRRYGWWGLAWLEAIVRLADHRRSEFEEQLF